MATAPFPINFSTPPPFLSSGTGGSGSNQFFPSMPSMPSPQNTPAPGIAPNQNPSMTATTGQPLQFTGPPGASGMTGIGKGMFAQNPLDPALTSQLFQWLQSQIGQGVPGFDLSTLLPSSGQATAPGQLNAPLTQLLQQMQSVFGSGGQIGQMAAGGVDAVAPWQKMVDAMQRQIGQGSANLKEQFNVEGGLASSPFGQAAVDYQTQSNKDLNSLLASMQFQGIQDQLQAGGMVQGAGQFMQGLDQQSIQNMLQEFIRTSPQYNPLLGMEFGAATTFPPVLNPKSGAGGLGGLLGSLGTLAGGASAGLAASSTGGSTISSILAGLAGLCWIAEVLYGVDDIRTHTVRAFLLGSFGETFLGSKIVFLYKRYGKRVAEVAKKSSTLRSMLKPIFNWFLKKAERSANA